MSSMSMPSKNESRLVLKKYRYELMRYDQMVMAIRECCKVDEVLQIDNQSLAAKLYAAQVGNKELEQQFTEFHLRAARRLGEILKEMAEKGERAAPSSAGGRNKKRQYLSDTDASHDKPTLAQLGVSKKRSVASQKLAAVPEDEFEEMLRLAKPMKPRRSRSKSLDHLWVWGRICDFEPHIDDDPRLLIAALDTSMRKDIRRIVPSLVSWLLQLTK